MPRLRTSIWFFLILVLLAVAAVAIPIIANLSQQLTPEQIAEARARWEKTGLASYDLRYLERTDQDETGDIYQIKVRGGEPVSLRVNDRLIPLEAMPAAQRHMYTVPG